MAHIAHYRETHPLPFVITHWINLVCMILLIFTGFCIHFPFFPYFMGPAKGFHVCLGFILVTNCICRIVFAFVFKSAPAAGTREEVKDYHNWLPQRDNRHQLWQWVKYYLFLRKTHPLAAKLGVLQKMTYWLIPFVIFFQFFTGLCLWEPSMAVPPMDLFTRAVGGFMAVRIIHYFVMYLFIIFMFIHVYLCFMEGLDVPKSMLFRQESGGLTYSPERHTFVGEDKNGYAPGSHVLERDSELIQE